MKLQRLIAILTMLLQKDCISASQFAEKFEVSVRTIYRDIAALESAGIPIVTHTGVNGGFSIIEGYKIDKKLFTHNDISTLLTSLYSVSGSITDAKLNQTLEKIKSLIPSEYVKSIELSSRQLYIDMTPWSTNPYITKAIENLKKGMEANLLIQFDYTGRNQILQTRIVEPHQLILKENHWYLRAFCKEREDFRIFRLSRMRNLALLKETFEPKQFETGMTDFKDWHSDKLIVIELVIDECLRERASDYCRQEYMTDMENGKIYIRMPFVESEMGYGVLLSMGHNCKVMHPAHVRQELVRRIELMRRVYPETERSFL